MKSYRISAEEIDTAQRNQIVDLTERIAKIVRQRGIQDGLVILYSPHTTAGVTINENYDPTVKSDMLEKLSKLIPHDESYYQHDEGNSDSHVKTALVGNSAMVMIEDGKLVLGRWQGIYFCEFDGPRSRRLFVKLVDFAPRQD